MSGSDEKGSGVRAALAIGVELAARLAQPPRNCGSCRHFRKNPQVIGQGICFWGPPQAVPVMAGSVPSIMSARPPVSAADACGQWTECRDENSN